MEILEIMITNSSYGMLMVQDVIGVAIDLDNEQNLYFQNGTVQ